MFNSKCLTNQKLTKQPKTQRCKTVISYYCSHILQVVRGSSGIGQIWLVALSPGCVCRSGSAELRSAREAPLWIVLFL